MSGGWQILGYDVLLDEDCKAWLVEVNHSPSFSANSQLDYMIKHQLLLDTLTLVNAFALSLLIANSG